MPKTQLKNVRCIRGATPAQEQMSRNNTNKVVFDPNTGLEWQDDTITSKNWESAIAYCRALGLDGDGWRLPDYNELYMLLDRTQNDSLDSVFQTRPDPAHPWFWTSTTYDGDHTNALEISLLHGDDKWYAKTGIPNVKCVRTRGLDLAATALSRITRYAATNGSSGVPSVSDYDDAGITGVSAANLNAVNQHIQSADESDTDSTVEVQDIVNSVVIANIAMPLLDVTAISGTSGDLNATLTNVDTGTLSKVRIYRNSSNNIAGKVKVYDETSLSATMVYGDTTLAACHTYYYWVEACSDQSGTELCRIDTTAAFDKTVPDAPTGLKAYATVIRSLNTQWNDNNDNGCTVKYHLYNRTSETGSFTQIPEVNDLTSGANGATATNVDPNIYIHYRVQAEDAQGRLSSLSCNVANSYPQYGVDTPQDNCRAAVGYTWGDQPNFPWASYNGYTDKVIFTWDDVVISLNTDGSVHDYANAYRVYYQIDGSNQWTGPYDIQNPFTYNNAQYQAFTITNLNSDTKVQLKVQTYYQYDLNNNGLQYIYSDPIFITGKTATAPSGTTGSNQLGLPPLTAASPYYPNKIVVKWTHTSGAAYYKLYYKVVTGACPIDSVNPLNDGYSLLQPNPLGNIHTDWVSWQERCYRTQACTANHECGAVGPHDKGNSTGN